MEFNDEVLKFIERLHTIKDTVQTEEATKMSIIVPFFQLLGYDVFNPLEFCPEYTADVGIKKGEKVDYAILVDGKPIILIEAKSANKKLDKHSSQLFRYFVTTSSKFAILTNGTSYKFYTDLDETNKMDKDPFLDIDLLHIKDNQINQLSKFKKENLNVSDIMDTASLLKYNNLFRNYIEQQFQNPTDDLVKLFLQPIYKGAKTQGVIEKFRPVLKKSLNDYLNDNLSEKLKFALNNATTAKADDLVLNTNDDWDILTTTKQILGKTIDVNKITLKYTESYIAVLFENNVRKWICRLALSGAQKTLILPDKNKKELRYTIIEIDDLKMYSKELIDIVERYRHPTPLASKEILSTKWGNYEMPEPYKISLNKGPRNDLKNL